MQYLRNRSIITQVTCFLFVILSLITLLLYLLLLIHFQIITSITSEFQEANFESQTAKTLKFYSSQYSKGVETLMRKNTRKAEQTQVLYKFLMSHPELSVVESPDCIKRYQGEVIRQTTFCYGIFSTQEAPLQDETNNLIRLSGLLTQVFPIQDQGLDISYAGTNEDLFFSIWPGVVFSNNYNPHARFWYKHHKSQIEASSNVNIITYSPPFMHWASNFTLILQTSSLVGPNETWDGVVSVALNFTQTFKFSPKALQEQFVMITDQQGNILLSQVFNGIVNLNNTEITGLNQEDSNLILRQANGLTRFQNESECSFHLENILCLRNKTSNQDILVSSYVINRSNFVMIIVLNPTNQFSQMNQYQQVFEKNLYELTVEVATIQGLIILITVTISIVLIIYIQRSLNRLTEVTCLQMYKSKLTKEQQVFGMTKITNDRNETLNKLKQAFRNISTLIALNFQGKCDQCLTIDENKYPLNYQGFKLRVKLSRLQNYQCVDQSDIIENIINHGQPYQTQRQMI